MDAAEDSVVILSIHLYYTYVCAALVMGAQLPVTKRIVSSVYQHICHEKTPQLRLWCFFLCV